ncbi:MULTISPECIES: family 43 glycosylhydrolase [unclassified Caulobacter]|uniref:family 43 glycosylhydrolase n=1 Tax=unclassified Caulobacter TaxID=2648921 RepID=UPI000AE0209C|nr:MULTISPECIES: family 43 glycosylhydrolase [unclassified Caulobacter]
MERYDATAAGRRPDRRSLLAGLSAAALGLAGGPAFAQAFYPTYPKPGTPKLEGADNSRRVIPPPAKDYWPFAGVSGAGRPVTKATQDGGWRSGLSEVSYKGPEPRRYPTAPWGAGDSATAVESGKLPAIRPIWDVHIRDTIVCLGGDGFYYMTGTTGDNCWAFNDGVELWRSRDLKTWGYLGLVWSIDRDGTWEKNWTARAGVPFRALWAPEIHFIGGNYYICHCISGVGIGVLRSTTQRPEGPYAHVLSDQPIKGGIDSTLFEDDDGKVYLSWGAGQRIREIKPDFSDFAGDWQDLAFDDSGIDPKAKKNGQPLRRVGFEGATFFKANGKYYAGACNKDEGRYSFWFASSDKLLGPYAGRHEGPPGGGGGNLFRDKAGRWWQTFFGNDDQMPFREKPGLIAVEFDAAGHVVASADQPFKPFA